MVDMGEFWSSEGVCFFCVSKHPFESIKRIFTKVEADWHLPKVTLPSNRVFSRFFLEIDSKEWRLYRFFSGT